MSHELRSPLNAILGFGQLMETETPPPTLSQQESITRILLAGWHLLKLIDEILDLAKVESGRVPLTREAVCLVEVLDECLDLVGPQAQKHGIRLVTPSFGLSGTVLADRTRLKQVLLNLLSNAIKYNSKGGSVEVVGERTSQGRIRVKVQDTGQGLAAEEVAQLFQAFNRLGQETGEEQGTGIGLVVAKRLIELMGGAIGVSSTVGVGTTFWIELAVEDAPVPSEAEPSAARPAQAVAAQRPRDCTLLLVEDNPASLELVKLIIARHPDLRLLTAADGPAALLSARAFRPDLILMDINLPGPNGFEILGRLHDDPATASIPAIAFSANAMPEEIARGLQAGFCQYLTKPFKVPDFMEAVDKALQRALQPSEGEPSHAERC
jgi:CheY-like chemotaxis protein